MSHTVTITLEFDCLDHLPTQKDVHEYLEQIMEDDGVKFQHVLPKVSDYPTQWIDRRAAETLIAKFGMACETIWLPNLRHPVAIAVFDARSGNTETFLPHKEMFDAPAMISWCKANLQWQ